MMYFRIYLAFVLTSLSVYTLVVGVNHGWNLLPLFFSDILAMTWAGQFNFDFMSFLSLSALWVSWRHRFSPGGIALGVLAFFGGMVFLATYLLVQISRSNGDLHSLLLGPDRANRMAGKF